jgi:peptidoglycan hydrolase-like protein with peptidoglycan-binding domain
MALPPYGADHTVLPNNPHSIRRFQRFHKLNPSGVVDGATRRKMRATNTRLDKSALSYYKSAGPD